MTALASKGIWGYLSTAEKRNIHTGWIHRRKHHGMGGVCTRTWRRETEESMCVCLKAHRLTLRPPQGQILSLGLSLTDHQRDPQQAQHHWALNLRETLRIVLLQWSKSLLFQQVKECIVKSVGKDNLEKEQWARCPDFYSWLFYKFAMCLGNLLIFWTFTSLSVKLRG